MQTMVKLITKQPCQHTWRDVTKRTLGSCILDRKSVQSFYTRICQVFIFSVV